MHIEVLDPKSKPRLRLSNSRRIEGKSGNTSTHKFVVLYLGPLSNYDDGQPNYLERLRESFKAGRPLIPALEPYCTIDPDYGINFNHNFTPGNPICISNNKHCSNILLDRILDELGLPAVFASCKHLTKIEYDVYGFFKFLVFRQILEPVSKFSTVLQNDNYYAPILDDHNPDNVYDTLTFIERFKKQIIQRMNTNLINNAGRSTEFIYYDVTNFYFETDEPDEDVLDECSTVIESGFRKFGVCKEKRKLPIVQMGLFMDNDGLPVSLESFSGNTLDHLTLKYSLKNSVPGLDLSRFILIGDQGVFAYSYLVHLTDLGNGYIVSKSLIKTRADEREWTYSDEGYTYVNNSFKYKSRIVERVVLDEKQNKRLIKEKVLVYWSEECAKKLMLKSESCFELLTQCSSFKDNFKVSRSQVKNIKRFLSRDILDSNTGELFDSNDLKVLIDHKKIEEYKRSFGFYQIITSELEMADLMIIEKYKGLTEIENQFKIMKSTLETRPIFV
ncbi:MAG: IS1634 family transposase, partial [Christensenellaceae bacterium]|nr:IS1634 family transposase [Christensenellaceae bacterium]